MTPHLHIPTLSPPPFCKEYEEPWNRLYINLDTLQSNYRYLYSKLPYSSTLYAVLKSDAYGHGLREVGKILNETGCLHFAIDSPQEGICLRNEGIAGEILLMNPIPLWMADLAVRYDLSVSVIHPSILQPLEESAARMGKSCKIHLNVNVGLHRMGIAPSKIMRIAWEASQKSHLQMEGLFGQPRESSSALSAFSRINDIYEKMKEKHIAPNRLHFANSTAFLAHPETVAGGIRIGILLYGVLPPEQHTKKDLLPHIKPAMSLESEIVQIRQLAKGSSIGYRSQEKTERDSIIGTIPMGYSQGIDRKVARNGYVLVKGHKAPYIGAISMNAATIDITDISNVNIGDTVTLIGAQGNLRVGINEIAENSGTIAAELMTRFGKGIARRYISNSQDFSTEVTIQQEAEEEILVQYIQTESDLPDSISVRDIIDFLKQYMKPYDDPEEIITRAMDYALSSYPEGKGFVILATSDTHILGVVVCIRQERLEIIPENIIVYACVHPTHRGKHLGSRIIQEAIECADGDLKLHVEKSNPAVHLYKRLGFTDNYFEMRYIKGDEKTHD